MIIEQIKVEVTAFELFRAFREEPFSFILDSSMQNERLGTFSFMGSSPFLTFQSKNHDIEIVEGEVRKSLQGNPFKVLKELLSKYEIKETHQIPFLGGAVGYLAYDMGHHIEKLPRTAIDDVNIPDCFLGFYENILAYDHQKQEAILIALGLKEKPEAGIAWLKQKLQHISLPACENQSVMACGEIESNFKKEDYLKAVQSIKDYIRSGDIYQANLTQRFKCHTQESPFCIYDRLRRLNPAPFACYMDIGKAQVLSSSPERFLKIQGNVIESRPIKGTRPRGATPEEDRANKQELLDSEKDKSELLMIVDLERNDLGKVSKTGTVKVPELFHLEEYATVHHLVSTVVGEMQEGIAAMDVIEAAFPGGSITGAPKIRAMEVIDELEPTQRNVYTGSIGYIGFNGDIDLNIAIRTILMKDDTAYFQAGGGIVWDSDPELEHQESLHKAKAMFRALRNE